MRKEEAVAEEGGGSEGSGGGGVTNREMEAVGNMLLRRCVAPRFLRPALVY
jgi:hypothetical protein